MITFFKMKHREWKLKLTLYSCAAALLSEHKNVAQLLKNMYLALKDIPADELRKELMDALIANIEKKE